MKYCIIIPDGMADYPQERLGGRTPLEAAKTPGMDFIAENGQIGVVQTIPDGFTPGSDIANLSLLGYDPNKYFTGRAPLEAVNIGVKLGKDDWAFRCNFVTVNDDIMADFSAGHISTKEADTLISLLNEKLSPVCRAGTGRNESIKFYTGTSYRHLMVYHGSLKMDMKCMPPHDIVGQSIKENLPRGNGSEMLIELMARSQAILDGHEINKVRIDLKENPANMIWLWGQGQKPSMPGFRQRYGISGAVITAVDLVKGIARLIGWDVINVPGATGYLDTDYAAKGKYAIEALKNHDLVVVHVEATDEASHEGNLQEKIFAIQNIDEKIISPILEAGRDLKNLRIMVLPDHYTPIEKKTHSREPVPFAIGGDGVEEGLGLPFTEANAQRSKLFIEHGHELMEYFLRKCAR
ncbi:MAG TPA: cofactor-independent phosphoglycerate mutase [Candidatus Brocadiia bacterium]|nr:cofactor-independent phosphoglycerate mutase [Candidatus Brocadiales bacterium]